MQAFLAFIQTNLSAAPGLMVFLSGVGVAAWSWWSKQKNQTIGENALTSVSGGYKYLSDSQQSRITQQDKMVAELESQLNARDAEIIRLRDLIENMRSVKATADAGALRSLANSEGGG